MATAYLTFGRFNPPTRGHEKLFDLMRDKASQEEGGEFFIFSSTTTDADKLKDGDVTSKLSKVKNPMSYDQKISILRKFFPDLKDNIVDSKKEKIVTIINALVYVYNEKDSGIQKYDNVVVVVGDDRLKEMSDLVNKYNGIEARHGLYEFDTIEVISLSRDASTGGDDISASNQRKNAVDGNLEAFLSGCPSTASKADCEDLYNTIRNIYGIQENNKKGTTMTTLKEMIISMLTEAEDAPVAKKRGRPAKPKVSSSDIGGQNEDTKAAIMFVKRSAEMSSMEKYRNFNQELFSLHQKKDKQGMVKLFQTYNFFTNRKDKLDTPEMRIEAILNRKPDLSKINWEAVVSSYLSVDRDFE